MPKLKWDEIGKRLYETGTKQGVLFPQASDGTYPEGVAWNGLTNVSANPSGADANPFYADDQKYIELRGAENFGGSIGAFTHPDEWYECDGCKVIAPGVVVHQQTRRPFGFTWRTIIGNDTEKEDFGYKIHLAWNATASPSGRDYQTTNESPDAVNMSWEFTTTPVKVAAAGVKPMSYLEVRSDKTPKANLEALEAALYGTDDTYAETEDASMDSSKTYYTLVNGEYTAFEGESFVEGTTYYEKTGEGTASHLPTPDEVFKILGYTGA